MCVCVCVCVPGSATYWSSVIITIVVNTAMDIRPVTFSPFDADTAIASLRCVPIFIDSTLYIAISVIC